MEKLHIFQSHEMWGIRDVDGMIAVPPLLTKDYAETLIQLFDCKEGVSVKERMAEVIRDEKQRLRLALDELLPWGFGPGRKPI